MVLQKKKKNLIVYLFLGIIIIIGIWLRIEGILTNSFAFTYDVGRDLLAVRKIVVDYNLAFIGPTTGLPGLFYGPWWYYILTIPFIITRGDPQGIVLFIALLGIVCIFLGFIIGKKVANEKLGLLIALFISFSPVMVGLSNQIWSPNLAPIILSLIFLILIQIYHVPSVSKKMFLISLGLLLGLLIDSAIVFGIYFTLGALSSLLIVYRKLSKTSLIFLISGFFSTLLPRIFFELKNNFIMTRTLFLNEGTAKEVTFSSPTVETVSSRLQMFYNQFAETFFHGNKIFSLFLIFFTLFILVRYFSRFSPIEKKFIKTFYIILIIFFVGISLFSHAVFDHYIVGLPIMYIFLVGIVLYKALSIQVEKYVAMILIVIIAFFSLQPIQYFQNFTKPLWEGNAAVYRNQLATVDYVYARAKGNRFNYIAYSPAVFDYPYQYLFLWYGEKKYGYTPSKEKQKDFFVILEPDHEKPFRLQDWLKIREGDGKILDEELTKGGIKVQTRVH